MDTIEKNIMREYQILKKEILSVSNNNNSEATMEKVFELWMFMNRFRNCDLGFYYDQDLHEAIQKLNKKKHNLSKNLKKKKKFKIGYIISNFSGTGGASIPHRFMLENIDQELADFEQFVLVSNLSSKPFDKNASQYKYLMEQFNLSDFVYLSPNLKWIQKAEYIEKWVLKNKIDFLVVDPCPASLYAIASKPALIQVIMSQDCYTFTIGPGAGDYTFLVTNDQIFKYKLEEKNYENNFKVVMLPLHSKEYVEKAKPLNLKKFNIPQNAVVSATSNLWKASFGDTEVFFDMLGGIARSNPHYHHIFVGTERSLDNLTFFLNKNKDLENQFHFIGSVDNIYGLLKSIDFWINSFPTSGGSDIEAALVGVPSIEIINNRNLNLHGVEFLLSRECIVVNNYEFKKLANKLINNKSYRNDLGNFLKFKIQREFDKSRIIREDILDFFKDKFNSMLNHSSEKINLNTINTREYEKNIALYNSIGQKKWNFDKKIKFLNDCITKFPEKSFGWIKIFELCIERNDSNLFDVVKNKITKNLKKDPRILTMIMLGYEKFNQIRQAIKTAKNIIEMNSKFSKIPEKLAEDLIKRNNYPKQIFNNNFPYFYDY